MKRFNVKVMLASVILVILLGSAVASDFPYAHDELLAKFARWAPGAHRPLKAEIIDDDGRGLIGCSSVVVRSTESATYLLTVAHCVESDESRRVLSVWVDGEKAVVLPDKMDGNTVRILRIGKRLHAPPVLFAKRLPVGTRTFSFGYAFRYGGLPVFAAGTVNAEPSFEIPYTGDTLHNAGSFYGWSGGGVYVYNERSGVFELMALTEELLGTIAYIFPIMSGFVFAYSVGDWINEAIDHDLRHQFSPSQQQERSKAFFANWESVPVEAQQQWQAWYGSNEPYRLKPFYAVEVGGMIVRIGPEGAVTNAWLEDRLKVLGSLQDVDWSEFNWEGSSKPQN